MTSGGAAVVDTDVFSRVVMAKATGEYTRFQSSLTGRPVVVAAQTVAELRAGALMRRWGADRVAAMETDIANVVVVPVDDDLCRHRAELEAECVATGHALGGKVHDGDRWIAATARSLGVPLASNDRIYRNAPGLTLLD